jgi:hypothetical protein
MKRTTTARLASSTWLLVAAAIAYRLVMEPARLDDVTFLLAFGAFAYGRGPRGVATPP